MPASSPATDFASTNLTPEQIAQLLTPIEFPIDSFIASILRAAGRDFDTKATKFDNCGHCRKMLCAITGEPYKTRPMLCQCRHVCSYCGRWYSLTQVEEFLQNPDFEGLLAFTTLLIDCDKSPEAIREKLALIPPAVRQSSFDHDPFLIYASEWITRGKSGQLKVNLAIRVAERCILVDKSLFIKPIAHLRSILQSLGIVTRFDFEYSYKSSARTRLQKFFASISGSDQHRADNEILFHRMRVIRSYNVSGTNRNEEFARDASQVDADVNANAEIIVEELPPSTIISGVLHIPHAHDWRLCPCHGIVGKFVSWENTVDEQIARVKSRLAALEREGIA